MMPYKKSKHFNFFYLSNIKVPISVLFNTDYNSFENNSNISKLIFKKNLNRFIKIFF